MNAPLHPTGVAQLRPAFIACALSVTPQRASDAEMDLAREAVALEAERCAEFTYAAFVRKGCYDSESEIGIALAAIRLVRGCVK